MSDGIRKVVRGRKVRVGVLGAGAWAKFAHLPGYKRDDRCEIVAIADPILERAQEFAREFGIPHAYGFLYHTLLRGTPPPSVPIILNVHFAHNVPKTPRIIEFGKHLQKAIKSFTGYKRVAMMASGGLSHFVIDEDLDAKVIKAMETGDEQALKDLTVARGLSSAIRFAGYQPARAAFAMGLSPASPERARRPGVGRASRGTSPTETSSGCNRRSGW